MEFVCYHNWAQVPESANVLFAQGEKESIFFSRLWFENLASTALEEKEQGILLACVVEDDSVLAILPLKQRTSEHWYALTTSYYSSLYTLLLAEQAQDTVLMCLAQGLAQLDQESLCLEPLAENDKNIQRFQYAMEMAGFVFYRYFRFYNWVHRLTEPSFADYMATRPAKVRNTIARKQRKLAREQGYEIRLFSKDDEHLQQGLSDYNAIFKASWKAHEPFAEFIDSLAKRLSQRGWLRLAVLYIAGQPAAAQFWIVLHGKANIFRLAYDEAWKMYSPGSILTQYLMQYVIETDKVKEIDFLTGNESYKQDWMSERQERWGLRWGLAHKNKHSSKWGLQRFLVMLKSWLKE